jgi:hypothetical protein
MDFELHRGGKRANPLSIDNYATGVSERSQQRGSLKDDGYMNIKAIILYLTVVPSFLTSNQISVLDFITLASIHIMILTIWLLFFGYIVILVTRKINFSIVSRLINIIGGVCLLCFTLSPYVHLLWKM